MWNNKSVLVAGGSGMIGRYLVDLLLDLGSKVTVVSLDNPIGLNPKAQFICTDLMHFQNCLDVCYNQDYVLNLLGVKGSPNITRNRAASFLVPQVMLSYNLMEAARRQKVERYLYTSSIGVYGPSVLFCEDKTWEQPPSPNDKFGGWAKRMGELQAEAYALEYDWKSIVILRPANVYGRYDNFDQYSGMVVPSLIAKVAAATDSLSVWGDGTTIRDFIHASDVARSMIVAMEKMPTVPINIGSGLGTSIKTVVKTVIECSGKSISVSWDDSKSSGDRIRLMDTSRAETLLGFTPTVSLKDGIQDTYDWYVNNKDKMNYHYNVMDD